MSVLDPWSYLAKAPQSIACTHMELRARDFEPVMAEGSGILEAISPTTFRYEFKSIPADPAFALEVLHRQRENPYDGLMRFRLVITDQAGVEFNAGWTIPELTLPVDHSQAWTFKGECDSLVTQALDGGSFPQGGTEVRFIIPRKHHVWLLIRELLQEDRQIEVLNTIISIRFDREADMLIMSAPASEALPLTYTENWLGEPLRILFGQLVFPRLVARSFGERGESQVWVRPSPAWSNDSNWIALWRAVWTEVDGEEFWTSYAAILTHIATARDEGDHPNFEANKLTHLYDEIIQATRGSRWVWTLTIASSIEGLVRMLVPYGTKRDDTNRECMQELVDHIQLWEGDDRLKNVATRAIWRDEDVGTAHALRNLVKSDLIPKDGFKAWDKVRNKVMHGNLIEPYSSEEGDRVLMNLASLLHSLTKLIVSDKDRAVTAVRSSATKIK